MRCGKKYGVLYCILKEKDNKDGIVDVMIRSEDASKVSRIVDKYELATMNTKVIKESILGDQNEKTGANDVNLNDTKEVETVPNLNRMAKASEKNLSKSNLEKNKSEKNRVGFDMSLCDSKKSVKKELKVIQNALVTKSGVKKAMNKTKTKRKER